MFRLLLSLLFLPAVVDACGLSFIYNESIQNGEATVEYSNDSSRLFRGPSYNGTQLPPWVPLKIHTIYYGGFDNLRENIRNDVRSFVNQALNRLEKMLKVRKPEKVIAHPCKISRGFKKEALPKDHNFLLYIAVHRLNYNVNAYCARCDGEVLMVDQSSRKVYHEYDAEYAKFKSQKNMFNGRPVSGYMVINLNSFERPIVNREERWIGTIMHEITHALIFLPWQYKYYINCDEATGKCQLYPGQKFNFKTPAKMPYEIPGILKKVNRKWLVRSGEKNHPVYVIILPAVRKAAAEYFNCPEIDGVELENQGGGATMLAHLEMRVYQHETMRATRTEVSAFSSIVLSVFEASGWYKVDYKQAEPMVYGKGKGCDFVMKSCGHFKAYPFCSDDSYTCNEDRTAVEMCNAFWYRKAIPPEYDYFERPKKLPWKEDYGGGSAMTYADFCPFYEVYNKKGKKGDKSDSKCSSPIVNKGTSASLQIFSETARCFELKKVAANSSITIKKTKNGKSETYEISHGCYEHKCDKRKVWIKAAKGKFHQCQKDGQLINVDVSEAGEQISFQIQCPIYKSLCEIKTTTRPTEKSTRPTEKSTRPSEKPSQPTGTSTRPSDTPTLPTEESTRLTEKSTLPTSTPTRPAEKSTRPSDTPSQPTDEPERPVEEPSRPADEPETTTQGDAPPNENGNGAADHHSTTISILSILFLNIMPLVNWQ